MLLSGLLPKVSAVSITFIKSSKSLADMFDEKIHYLLLTFTYMTHKFSKRYDHPKY